MLWLNENEAENVNLTVKLLIMAIKVGWFGEIEKKLN